MSIDKLNKINDQLLPTGRAFKNPKGGWLWSLFNALNISLNKAYRDNLSILNSIIPDNDKFTVEDAEIWERRLGLISSSGATLEDRKSAIYRKMRHPGNIPARQHYLYVQGQLREAGFDVYVYENRFANGGAFDTKTPYDAFGFGTGDFVQHGDHQHGDRQHGGFYWQNKVVNYIDEEKDSFFVPGSYRATFFISGDPITSAAYVDANRKEEFRQLILKLKPAQMCAFLNVYYV